jgi:hypothetical protein
MRAHNAGIKLAKGEYIICLGADDKLHSGYVEKCVREIGEMTAAEILLGFLAPGFSISSTGVLQTVLLFHVLYNIQFFYQSNPPNSSVRHTSH